MYLLQVDVPDAGTLFFVLLLAFALQCLVLYFIIQRATASANEKVYRQAFIHNQLMIEQLLANGVSQQRVLELAEQMAEPVKDNSKMEAFDKSFSRVLRYVLLAIALFIVILLINAYSR